jgi:hypothetical protein
MKKRRMLLIGLSLALLLVLLVPSAAFAKNEKNTQPAYTDFTGAGYIYVTAMPDPVVQGNIWSYSGEIAEGVLAQSDWDLLANTVFWSSHDSVVKVADDGTTCGWMWGTFTLSIDANNVMTGTFNGKITGNLYLGNISDTGSWMKTSGTGAFASVNAFGNWSAQLTYDQGIGTLVGPLSWQGKHTTGSTSYMKPGWNSFKWSPFKIWKPFTPSAYSWFRKH